MQSPNHSRNQVCVSEIFEVRRELVHFKKAVLHLLQEVLSLERGMIRHMTFFYREFKRCGIECMLSFQITTSFIPRFRSWKFEL